MSQWTHKNNPALTLLVKEIHPTLVVGEVSWNTTDIDSQSETLNFSPVGLLTMWSPNGNYN